ncbi:hypothetical protein LJC04_00265 [Ruminococcaceae bacterium OttesenSCG-928-O06]|nr:hypothetical protein [Ruminococcaceae bacterium OttesenSCG-928-O06]
MIITVDEIVQSTTGGFAQKYPHFKEFQTAEAYFPYWKLCLQALQDRDLLGHIIFCNDLFGIPPVKTFLCYFAPQLQEITAREDARLDDFVKKAIGAVWGYVFKVVFSYAQQKSVSVSLNRMFMVKTATCYLQPQKTLVLAY